jgi:hypothetical protein
MANVKVKSIQQKVSEGERRLHSASAVRNKSTQPNTNVEIERAQSAHVRYDNQVIRLSR